MPIFSASAPGKIILFGEHAVVYGQPAIAVPVVQVRVRAVVTPTIQGDSGQVIIEASDVDIYSSLENLHAGDPIGETIRRVMVHLKIQTIPACKITLDSDIPVASGLGSGAAVSVAIIRSLAGFLGHPLSDQTVSDIAYEIEKIHHGTPSGVDNTVVTYKKPVYFIKNKTLEHFKITKPFTLIIGDSGIQSPTRDTVGDVRKGWTREPQRYDRVFSVIGSITKTARQSIEDGYPKRLGPLMDENHKMLQELGVSSPELDQLVKAAKDKGALGAKLSGGGRGGNMIALVENSMSEQVAEGLRIAGAINTITTKIQTST